MAETDRMGALPEVIKGIMSSPEVAEIMKNFSSSPAGAESEKKEPAAAPQPLSDDIMDKLPLVMNMLRGMGGEPAQTPTKTETSPPMPDISAISEKLPQVMSALSDSGIMSGKQGIKLPGFVGDKNRKALLKALRPYMNDRKKNAIDAMLSVNSMAEIMALLMGGDS
ncbi:MAG: hypothetical protein IJ499_06285 [Clostridia bacterium]|nr:hypothetical protein [Clostridia bacterium]